MLVIIRVLAKRRSPYTASRYFITRAAGFGQKRPLKIPFLPFSPKWRY